MIDKELEKKYLHNFGPENPIPKGAIALCGIESTYDGEGITTDDVDLEKCCPECLKLSEKELKQKNKL